MKTFGQRVQDARKAKGLTLEQLGKVIRSHKGYISGIENGKVRPPSPKMLPVLCKKLGLPVESMAALAYWEKRDKLVTASALLGVLEDVITAEQQKPPAKEAV